MGDNVTPIWNAAKPAFYTVNVAHFPGGNVEVSVEGIASDTHSRKCAAQALRDAADMLDNNTIRAEQI